MSNNKNNTEVVVLLDDGETWAGSGYALLITDETKRAFLKQRGEDADEEVSDADVNESFWDELMEDKAIRSLDAVASYISIQELVKFYLAHNE